MVTIDTKFTPSTDMSLECEKFKERQTQRNL